MRTAVRKRLKAIVYIRVSMKREEMYSPEQQLFACEQYAKMNDIDIVDVVEDLDLSGRNFAKRKVSEIIERVDSGEAVLVLVWKWSRFGRNILQSQVNLHALEQAGGQLRAVTEDFDTTTSAGKFSRDQMLLIADFQSNMIGDVWKDTHNRRKRDGRSHHGRQQFGYQRCPDCKRNPENTRSYLPCDTCHGVPVVDPVRGPALAEVFERVVRDEPMRSISKDMAARGIRSVNGKEMTTTKWYQVMDTGFAAGLIRYRVASPGDLPEARGRSSKPETFNAWYEGKHKALITMDTWEAYKKKRQLSSGAQNRRESQAKYAFSSLARCMRLDVSETTCRSVMTAGQINKNQRGFRCDRVHSSGGCKGLSVPTLKLTKAVLKWLVEHATGEGAGKAAMLQAAAAERASANAGKIRGEISKLEKKRDTLLEMTMEGLVSREDYERKNAEYVEKIKLLEQRASRMEAESTLSVVPPPEYFSGILGIWPRMAEHERRAALKKVIRRIEVHKTEGAKPNIIVIVPRWAAPDGPEWDQAASGKPSSAELVAAS